MIALRILACAFGAAVVYALYLPAAYPPEHFLQQMRMEHARNMSFWGEAGAEQILERSLSLYARQDDLAPAGFAATPTVPVTAVNAAVAEQMTAVLQRLWHNRYAQGLDAMLLLVLYRSSELLQWLPWLAGFVLIAGFDGYTLRLIRSREFRTHSPLRFALCSVGAALGIGITLPLLLVPVPIDPTLLGCAVLVVGVLAGRAIGNLQP
jgi:hypothetical protein